MSRIAFNPAGILVNLAIGWCLMSFMQALVRGIGAGSQEGLVERFKSIALFHDRPAAFLNAAIMAAIWVVTTGIWFAVHRK